MKNKFGTLVNSTLKATALFVFVLTSTSWAGTRQPGYPFPHVQGPTVPQSVVPGGPDFTLSVFGANFIPGSVVNWNRQRRATNYVSPHELEATILASDIAVPTAAMVTVTTPSPNGLIASSTYFQVEVHVPNATMHGTQEYVYDDFFGFLGGVADLSNDGSLDVVGSRGGSHFFATVGSLMNDGSGSFYSGPSLTNKEYPFTSEVAFGDFDVDGNIDLMYVVGTSTQIIPYQLGVSLNNGDGVFTVGPTFGDFTAASFPIVPDFVVGDFNQDGALDVATTQGGGQVARIFLGNGDGTFAKPTSAFAGQNAGDLFVGDFNGDGKLDLLGAAISNEDTYWEFKILLGNGDGTFQSPKTVGVFPYAPFFSPFYYVNDFNHDGNLDIAFANPYGQIGILLGNGDGTFQSPTYYTVGEQAYFTFVVGDFNSDGYTDILVQQDVVNTDFSILLGNGDGTFQNPQALLPGGLFPGVLFTVADFNNDGLLDLSVPQYDYYVFLQQ